MSVYSEIKGTIKVSRDVVLTVKMFLEDILPYANASIRINTLYSTDRHLCYDVYISVEEEGEDAISFVREFIDTVKEKDPSCFIDIESTVRWYS